MVPELLDLELVPIPPLPFDLLLFEVLLFDFDPLLGDGPFDLEPIVVLVFFEAMSGLVGDRVDGLKVGTALIVGMGETLGLVDGRGDPVGEAVAVGDPDGESVGNRVGPIVGD